MLDFSSCVRRARRAVFLTPVLGLASLVLLGPAGQAQTAPVRLHGHIPALVANSRVLDRAAANEDVRLALTLPLRNQAQLDDLLKRLYDPQDPAYGRFLTPEQFTALFAPTKQDYDAVAAFAVAHGLTVVGIHSNRTVLDVEGSAGDVEKAFSLRLLHFQAPDGRVFRTPDVEPAVPASLAGRIAGVIGLDTAAVWHKHSIGVPAELAAAVVPYQTGSGPGGGLTPGDIRTAYDLNTISLNGAGQTLGLFELDGYRASDITAYESYYGLPNVPLQNVLVDGASGSAGSGADEVTLDIELQIALAPGASKVIVYEGPNSSTGLVDTYNRIAADNLAKQISTSWGIAEASAGSAIRNSENTAFQQMAAQGQSIYAASGDSGAYDNGSTLSVDDPASQPYMVGVGGTSLTTNGAGGAWKAETTWNGGSVRAGAGGGGISAVWSIPSYQAGVVSAASKGSTTMRNVPDVALDADPNTGYSIYYNGNWYLFGGTSCAAPLWSAFNALVNQQRVSAGSSLLGFVNNVLYPIANGAHYSQDFHDIADGSTNLYYPAVTGYDDATGWGSFNGVNLLTDLAGSTPPGGGGGGTSSQLLGNPGFENGSANPSPWVPTAGVIDNSTSEPAHSGSWKAWLDGYGTTHTDTLLQQVSIPATITSATLSFWLHIDTAERTRTTAYDTLKVQIRNASGAVLTTLATYSNLNHNTGYVQKSFNLSAYKGTTIQVYLVGSENSSRQTSFVVDDFALNVQ